jgi:hypothetical protein
MKRCNDCADKVVDTDAICTGCRMAEWRDQQEQARLAREKAYALEAHRAAYLSRKKAIRDSIKAGVLTALGLLLFLALFQATKDAMRYEWETKPALLRANGVR